MKEENHNCEVCVLNNVPQYFNQFNADNSDCITCSSSWNDNTATAAAARRSQVKEQFS